MRLNTIAGRTYNDLAQYPIFPWVLCDYTSPTLDLSDANVYRDLSKPMGVQNKAQKRDLEERYNELARFHDPADDLSPAPFHYGATYSNPAFVIWYLLRLEPYASLHIHLHDGHFDKPDRLFDSVERTWEGCTNNPTDVKELIPEFFYLPDFLENGNLLDMGETQSGQVLSHVKLPPWAKNIHDFVRQHRLALESEFVSMNLHHWIDLIFGYKQRPPHLTGGSIETERACNVYRSIHYLDAYDLDKLERENKDLFTLCQKVHHTTICPASPARRPPLFCRANRPSSSHRWRMSSGRSRCSSFRSDRTRSEFHCTRPTRSGPSPPWCRGQAVCLTRTQSHRNPRRCSAIRQTRCPACRSS